MNAHGSCYAGGNGRGAELNEIQKKGPKERKGVTNVTERKEAVRAEGITFSKQIRYFGSIA